MYTTYIDYQLNYERSKYAELFHRPSVRLIEHSIPNCAAAKLWPAYKEQSFSISISNSVMFACIGD